MAATIRLSPPPQGSKIAVAVDPERIVLSWPNFSGGWPRFLVAAFMLCWLGGWATGEFSALNTLLGGRAKGWGSSFLVFWLGAWTVGGLAAMATLIALLRPSRPASLAIEEERILHDPGRGFPRDWGRAGREGRNPWSEILRPGKRDEIPRAEAGEVRLRRAGKKLRLTIDRGAERIVIGQNLGEPEKEWLAEVLRSWKKSG